MGIMAPSRFKTLSIGLLLSLVVVFTTSAVYMYFSHDVQKLRLNYPTNDGKEFSSKKPKGWVKLQDISFYAKWAIVLSEDWSFYQHDGIDLEQMKVAINEMVEKNKFRGASTITQQMVKNVFLTNERTLWRKLHEIVLAQKVEKELSKDRILEVYLNVIEFGPDIYGINQAALHYFKKHPSGLNPKEAAFLAMLLPSPKKYYRSFKKRKLTTFASTRIEAILVKMRMAKVISKDQYEFEKGRRFDWE